MRHALPIFLALLPLSGCIHPATALRDGPARFGETVRVGGPSVRPVKLLEDSRCPENARCVWAGRVVLRAVVTFGGQAREMDLTLGQAVQVADGSLTLVSALPEKSANSAAAPRDYRFVFDFQGGI